MDVMIFKRCTMSDFINGSFTKRIAQQYKGPEAGTAVLGLKIDQALVYDGKYQKWSVPYLEKYDSKKDNESIFKNKNSLFKEKKK